MWLLALLALVVWLAREAPVVEALTRTVQGWANGQPFPLEIKSIGGGHYLARDTAEAFELMREAAGLEGVALVVNSAWRDYDAQALLRQAYEAGLGALAARPGYSPHEAGRAVDLDTANGTNKAFRWLEANAARFGFKRTVSSEPWHWEHA